MPIGYSFCSQFGPGDVLYGTAFARDRYYNSLPRSVRDRLFSEGLFIVMGDYNNQTFAHSSANLQPVRADYIRLNLEKNRNASNLNFQQKESLAAYYDALAKSPKHTPFRGLEMDIATVKAKGNRSHRDLAIRRACKFGLEYFISQEKGTVHFVLDHPTERDRQICSSVVSKATFESLQHKIEPHVPLTTSELRYAFRRRDEWEPTGRIKFYFKEREVLPPWRADPVLWAEYETYLTNKRAQRTSAP